MPWPKGKTRVLTEEHKRKISQALKGKPKSESHRQALSKALRGRKNPKLSETKKRLFSEGKLVVWNKGKTKNDDERIRKYAEKISKTKKRLYKEGKIEPPFKGHNWGWCKKCGKYHKHPRGMKGKKHSEELKKKRSEQYKGEGNPHYGKKHSKKTRMLISEKIKKRIREDESYREKLRQAGIKGYIKAQRKPTSPERKLISIIKKFNLPYKYVGDGKFTIGNLCPDFVSTDGSHRVIEVFSHPWHTTLARKSQLLPVRKHIFEKEGYEMLVLWDYELEQLSDEEIASRIIKFHKKRGEIEGKSLAY